MSDRHRHADAAFGSSVPTAREDEVFDLERDGSNELLLVWLVGVQSVGRWRWSRSCWTPVTRRRSVAAATRFCIARAARPRTFRS